MLLENHGDNLLPADPPHLTTEYCKARRILSLFSALLVGWELVGISIGAKPFNNYEVRLINPEAAPLILLALILYFVIRLFIEWYHSSPLRRSTLAARIDFGLSLCISFMAVSIFSIQKILDIRLVEELTAKQGLNFVSALLITTSAGMQLLLAPAAPGKRIKRVRMRTIAFGVGGTLGALIMFILPVKVAGASATDLRIFSSGCLAGIGLVLVFYILRKILVRRRNKRDEVAMAAFIAEA